tara:strand:+ start:61 stop:639 length:579 start_codon:yes stop_codon:yes gene_type:complete
METKKLISNKGNILKGPLLIKPKIFHDKRGYFFESWNQSVFDNQLGEKIIFSQDNISFSEAAVLRGLHYQIPPITQGKLVRCTAGEIFDVAVDIRESSETFGEWVSVKLNNNNKLMLWIPVGFAHGFLSLKDNSEVSYKANGYYSKEHERSIRWNDKSLNIKWPLQIMNKKEPNLSEKDANAPLLNEANIFY